jgi:hypothetical protein
LTRPPVGRANGADEHVGDQDRNFVRAFTSGYRVRIAARRSRESGFSRAELGEPEPAAKNATG